MTDSIYEQDEDRPEKKAKIENSDAVKSFLLEIKKYESDQFGFLMVNSTDTRKDVKAKVEKMWAIPAKQQIWSINGRETSWDYMPHDSVLATHTLESGSTVVISDGVRQANALFQVFVRGIHGESLTLDVTCDVTVEQFKLMIQKRPNYADWTPCAQRLIFSGRQLEDDRTLADYGVSKECTIQLVGRLRAS